MVLELRFLINLLSMLWSSEGYCRTMISCVTKCFFFFYDYECFWILNVAITDSRSFISKYVINNRPVLLLQRSWVDRWWAVQLSWRSRPWPRTINDCPVTGHLCPRWRATAVISLARPSRGRRLHICIDWLAVHRAEWKCTLTWGGSYPPRPADRFGAGDNWSGAPPPAVAVMAVVPPRAPPRLRHSPESLPTFTCAGWSMVVVSWLDVLNHPARSLKSWRLGGVQGTRARYSALCRREPDGKALDCIARTLQLHQNNRVIGYL